MTLGDYAMTGFGAAVGFVVVLTCCRVWTASGRSNARPPAREPGIEVYYNTYGGCSHERVERYEQVGEQYRLYRKDGSVVTVSVHQCTVMEGPER